MSELTPENMTEYYKGIELFNDLEFFDAHDQWEELWQAYTGTDRRFFQGLIQAAVCLYHFGNGNTRGAKKLLISSTDYLRPFAPEHLSLPVTKLIDDLFICCDKILASSDSSPPAVIDPDLIPTITLTGDDLPPHQQDLH